MVMQSLMAFLPFLQLVAAPAGAGALTVALFNWLRGQFPTATLLHAPLFARYAAIVLAGLISAGASMGVASLTSADVVGAADAAIAGMVGSLTSQLVHGLSLPTTAPEAGPGYARQTG
jgi:hypothetical protein